MPTLSELMGQGERDYEKHVPLRLMMLGRDPYQGERDFFSANPRVGGMAADDNRVVINPYSPLGPAGRASVFQNEAYRIKMRDPMFAPPEFQLTPEQQARFSSYSNNPLDMRSTIIARLLTGDPSAGAPSFLQQSFADRIR